jgi:hypothetical protein
VKFPGGQQDVRLGRIPDSFKGLTVTFFKGIPTSVSFLILAEFE